VFVPQRLGLDVASVVVPRVGPDGWIYRYDDGVYVESGEPYARATAQWLLDERTRTGHVREAVEWIRTGARVNPISFDPDPAHIVRVGNGILDLRAWGAGGANGGLTPYTSENASLIKLPWNLTASECPRVDAFLSEVFANDPEMIRHALEIIGYCCQARNPLRRAVLLIGSGANGKSILLHLLTCLLGAGNVATLPLGRLSGDDRFAPSSLVGKLANVCGDLPSSAPKDVSLFKQITGQDRIFAERKGRDGFNFTCGAVPVFSANEYPPLARCLVGVFLTVGSRAVRCHVR
jgi:putative DNA primase/helicase